MPGSEFAFLQAHQTNSAMSSVGVRRIWKRFGTMWKLTTEEPLPQVGRPTDGVNRRIAPRRVEEIKKSSWTKRAACFAETEERSSSEVACFAPSCGRRLSSPFKAMADVGNGVWQTMRQARWQTDTSLIRNFDATGLDTKMKRTFKPRQHVWWEDVEHSNRSSSRSLDSNGDRMILFNSPRALNARHSSHPFDARCK
jgi:hypothetical protein